MSHKKINVIAYSGYRGEERPRIFTLHDEEIEIVEILSRWIEEDIKNKTRKRFFKVKGLDGYRYNIYYDEKTKEWFLAVKNKILPIMIISFHSLVQREKSFRVIDNGQPNMFLEKPRF
jgi:hypothetical protein